MSPAGIRVGIADDHPVVRGGLRSLLESLDGVVVVGEAADGREAVRLAVTLKPDVLVMDLDMPVADGIEATREITRQMPSVAVLVLTMFSDDDRIRHALRAGARGYLVKGASQAEIHRAITAVFEDGAYFGAGVATQALRNLSDPTPYVVPLPVLTDRERDVLGLVANGLSNQAVADRLGLSAKTVANHLSSIFVKLGVASRAEASALARKEGLE